MLQALGVRNRKQEEVKVFIISIYEGRVKVIFLKIYEARYIYIYIYKK